MSRPGSEPGPSAREASTLEKSHLDSLYADYSEPLLELRWRSAYGLYTTFIYYCNLSPLLIVKHTGEIVFTVYNTAKFATNSTPAVAKYLQYYPIWTEQ